MQMSVIPTHGTGLVPAGNSDYEKYMNLKKGQTYLITLKEVRNPKFHAKFMSLLKLTLSNLREDMEEDYKTIEDILTEVKMQTGHREKRTSIGGTVYWVPKSIAFENLDELAFREFYDKAVAIIIKHFLPETLPSEIEEMLENY